MGRYAPTIDATGCNGPDFATILANLTADYLSIFGDDAILDPDVQDGQLVGVFAKGLSDASNAVVAAFNSFSPSKAQGNGLSSVVKINGLKRKIPTLSVVSLTLVGQAGITITNGQAFDGVNTWALPTTVTIPPSGTITVQAVCTAIGAITAAANSITQIKTQVFGWQTVTNAAQAIPGTPVETDAALRVRQSQSTSLPSQTIFEGIVASIQAIAGVTRARGYENNTGSTDTNGIPTKTLAFVVEGGVTLDIQNAIAQKITPGIPTLGAQSTTIIDSKGSTRLVKFDRPTPGHDQRHHQRQAAPGLFHRDSTPGAAGRRRRVPGRVADRRGL
jgi:uncharacterized phage protein gp47/JayE